MSKGIDLSYAVKKPVAIGDVRSLSLNVKGWAIGWAFFQGEHIQRVGHFSVRGHVKGNKVPIHSMVLAAFYALTKLASDFHIQLVISSTPKAEGPLWSLPPVLAASRSLNYKDLPDWRSHVEQDMKALRGWATLLLGHAPENELETVAIALAVAATKINDAHLRIP